MAPSQKASQQTRFRGERRTPCFRFRTRLATDFPGASTCPPARSIPTTHALPFRLPWLLWPGRRRFPLPAPGLQSAELDRWVNFTHIFTYGYIFLLRLILPRGKVTTSTQRTQPRIAMTQTSKPSNQQVPSWMQQRQVDRTPPPAPEEIRRQLGWGLIEAQREETNRSK